MTQSLSQLWTHLVFSTKERKPFLIDIKIRQDLYDYIKCVSHKHGCDIMSIGGIEDHIHLLINLNKNISLSSLIREIKSASTIWVKKNHVSFADFYWQRGYGAFSVSQSNIDAVKKYITQQEQHHRKMDFKQELIELFRLHDVHYLDQYIWS